MLLKRALRTLRRLFDDDVVLPVQPGQLGHRVGGCDECSLERDLYLTDGGDPERIANAWHLAPPFEQE
jgi:hypothetical protein